MLRPERPRINLARLPLPSLRLVVLCEEMRSLSAAAPVANMSVSGASHKLAALEAALGIHLFVRERRGLRCTDAGRLVALHARRMLLETEALLQALSLETHAMGQGGEQRRVDLLRSVANSGLSATPMR